MGPQPGESELHMLDTVRLWEYFLGRPVSVIKAKLMPPGRAYPDEGPSEEERIGFCSRSFSGCGSTGVNANNHSRSVP
jgi:hypothetical protein